MEEMKRCVLYDRECIECGECDMCDLNPDKVCDNCMRCVQRDTDFLAIAIDEIQVPEEQERADD